MKEGRSNHQKNNLAHSSPLIYNRVVSISLVYNYTTNSVRRRFDNNNSTKRILKKVLWITYIWFMKKLDLNTTLQLIIIVLLLICAYGIYSLPTLEQIDQRIMHWEQHFGNHFSNQ